MSFTWVTCHLGMPVPQGAIAGGEEDGTTLYVCRAEHGGGLHPGKLIGGQCNIEYGGDELQKPAYEVLVGDDLSWGPSGGPIPVPGGQENGAPLFVCRAHHYKTILEIDAGVHPGKLLPNGNCHYGYGGDGHHKTPTDLPRFEVLYQVPFSTPNPNPGQSPASGQIVTFTDGTGTMAGSVSVTSNKTGATTSKVLPAYYSGSGCASILYSAALEVGLNAHGAGFNAVKIGGIDYKITVIGAVCSIAKFP